MVAFARLASSNTLLDSRVSRIIAILLVIVVGFGIRLLDLTDPPMDFHGTRQLRAATIARGMYYEMSPSMDTTFGISASRSFQPDPFMIMWILISAWSLNRWMESPTWKWTVLSGGIGQHGYPGKKCSYPDGWNDGCSRCPNGF